MRAVFFDLDETLIDHRHACLAGIRALQERHEKLRQKPAEQLEAEFWERLDGRHKEVLTGALSFEEARVDRFRSLFAGCGIEMDEPELTLEADRYKAAYEAAQRPMRGAVDLLLALRARGVRIAVLTNGFTKIQQRKVEACGLQDLLDHVITSEEAGAPKPGSAIFAEAMRRCEVAAHETVMIGDSWLSDVAGAQQVGVRAYWLNRGRMACPDAKMATEIQELSELDDLLF